MSYPKAEALFKKIYTYAKAKKFNLKRVKEGYELACDAHKNQERKTGEPYIIHPVTVAFYLTQYNCDEETLISALLHDTVEDTPVTLQQIEKQFGKGITQLIDGSTKFDKDDFQTEKTLDRTIESLRKWFSIMQEDIRVAIMKLVDRLHNMETLQGIKKTDKQIRISKETFDVFVKIAEKLSISDIEEKLADISLSYIDPSSYKDLQKIQKKETQSCLKTLPEIKSILTSKDTNKKIVNIIPHTPSLLKMYDEEVHLKEDIKGALSFEFSIIAKNIQDCYSVLYLLHKTWKADHKKFKDFINSPASNGYRGLHTTIFFKRGRSITFKIRTQAMEDYSNYGITLFCFQKKQNGKENPEWIKTLSHVTTNSKQRSQEFWQQLQHDILERYIIIHTENKKTLLLPSHPTALDAAFHSYEQKAWYLKKAFINGIQSPLYKELKENDTVHYQFGKNSKVEYEWLEYANTAFATSLIKQGLQQQISNQKKILLGKSILEQELLKEHIGFIEEVKKETLHFFLEKHKIPNVNQLYQKVAEGEIDPQSFTHYLKTRKKFFSEKPYFSKLTLYFSNKEEEPIIFDTLKAWTKKIKKYVFLSSQATQKITASLYFQDKKQEQNLKNQLLQKTDIESLTFRQTKEKYILLFMMLGVIILWGIEPSLVHYAYRTTDVTPSELMFFRLWATTIPFLLWMIPNTITKRYKIIPLFNKYILLATLGFLGVLYFRYPALLQSSPAQFMILHRNYVFLTTLYFLPLLSLLKNTRFIFSIFCMLGASGLLLFLTPEWSWHYKFLSIVSFAFFTLFHVATRHFLENFSVKARYFQFNALIFLYSSIIITFFHPITIERAFFLLKTHGHLLFLLTITIFVPYLLSYYLNLKDARNNQPYLSSLLGFTWITTLLSEMYFFKTPFSILTLSSGILMSIGIIFITKVSQKYPLKKKSV